MRIIGNNPAADNAEITAVASGTLPDGKPVIVNADGTVSVISGSSTSESAGTATAFTSGITPDSTAAVYDTAANKVVVFVATSGGGYSYIGTVSGTSISFASGTNFDTGATWVNAAYDPDSGKILVLWSYSFKARMATVSGNSISYGSIVTVDADKLEESAISYDTVNQKFVIAYTDWTSNNRYGTSLVGTVSGTSISFGTPVIFRSARTDAPFACVYDTASGKTVIAYSEVAGSNNIKAIVGTISNTSISFGSAVTVSTAGSYTTGVYDSEAQKTVIFYYNSTGRARVGTVSGTSISFGSEVVFDDTAQVLYIKAVYNTQAQKIVFAYFEGLSSVTIMQSAKVSGTSITFDDPLEVSTSGFTQGLSSAYDPDTDKVILTYKDPSNNGYYVVYQAGYTSTNLTAENFIGFANGAASDTGTARVQIGSGINGAQSSLTAGQQYFVQTDGTLGLTAADPSVIAGTAISATEIIVKG